MASDSQANEKRKRKATQKIARLRAGKAAAPVASKKKKYVAKKKAGKKA